MYSPFRVMHVHIVNALSRQILVLLKIKTATISILYYKSIYKYKPVNSAVTIISLRIKFFFERLYLAHRRVVEEKNIFLDNCKLALLY